MVKSGARISYGSDWPVTSYLPLLALAVPTHRQSPEKWTAAGWSAHEAISVEESLSFYTAGVAYQGFNEKRCGEIAVGMQADLMVLEQSPLEVEPHDVAHIKIRAVYKSGVAVIG
jgi:predicted amidohydrolase YtcJ